MSTNRPIKSLAALGAVLALTTTLAACSGSGEDAVGTQQDGPVELTIATFNEFGYEELLTEYQETHPGVTVKHKKAATTNEARDNLTTRLAAGSGLSDVEAIEVDWLPELLEYSDQFVDLNSPDVDGRWLEWKTAAATDAEGRLIGYGTDIGPEAICYRSDLFAEAGLPTDREEVAQFLGESWEDYFAAGKKFAAESDVPWYDSAGATWQGMINQIEQPYEKEDGTVVALENPEVRATYDAVLAGTEDGLSAKLVQWSEDWTKSFQNDGFATTLCPGWMLGVIEGNAEGVEGWDIANTFPGGGGNWGGSYLTVPEQGENAEAAQELAAWLTAPEQQLKAFASKGTFPSQAEALTSDELLDSSDEFFNDAPTGQILADRAEAVTVTPYKGAKYFAVNDAVNKALQRVEDGTMSADESWEQFANDVRALG